MQFDPLFISIIFCSLQPSLVSAGSSCPQNRYIFTWSALCRWSYNILPLCDQTTHYVNLCFFSLFFRIFFQADSVIYTFCLDTGDNSCSRYWQQLLNVVELALTTLNTPESLMVNNSLIHLCSRFQIFCCFSCAHFACFLDTYIDAVFNFTTFSLCGKPLWNVEKKFSISYGTFKLYLYPVCFKLKGGLTKFPAS